MGRALEIGEFHYGNVTRWSLYSGEVPRWVLFRPGLPAWVFPKNATHDEVQHELAAAGLRLRSDDTVEVDTSLGIHQRDYNTGLPDIRRSYDQASRVHSNRHLVSASGHPPVFNGDTTSCAGRRSSG